MLGAKLQRREFWTFLALSFECDEASAKEGGRAASGWTKEARATSQGTMPMACWSWKCTIKCCAQLDFFKLLHLLGHACGNSRRQPLFKMQFATLTSPFVTPSLSSPSKVSFFGMFFHVVPRVSWVSVYWPVCDVAFRPARWLCDGWMEGRKPQSHK